MSAVNPERPINLSSPKLDELDGRLWAAFAKCERITRENKPALDRLKRTVREQQTASSDRPTVYLDPVKLEKELSDSALLKLPPPKNGAEKKPEE